MSSKSQTDGQITGRHVLIAILAFFGVVFLVNGIFLYRAIGTYTGLVANEPYRKGLEYNQRIAAAEQQAALGWSHKLTLTSDGRLQFYMRDRTGAPLDDDLEVTVAVGRPSTAAGERTLRLNKAAPGRFEAAFGKLAPGRWIASVRARRRMPQGRLETAYRAKERVWLKP